MGLFSVGSIKSVYCVCVSVYDVLLVVEEKKKGERTETGLMSYTHAHTGGAARSKIDPITDNDLVKR